MSRASSPTERKRKHRNLPLGSRPTEENEDKEALTNSITTFVSFVAFCENQNGSGRILVFSFKTDLIKMPDDF
jgi:hypothetical protein